MTLCALQKYISGCVPLSKARSYVQNSCFRSVLAVIKRIANCIGSRRKLNTNNIIIGIRKSTHDYRRTKCLFYLILFNIYFINNVNASCNMLYIYQADGKHSLDEMPEGSPHLTLYFPNDPNQISQNEIVKNWGFNQLIPLSEMTPSSCNQECNNVVMFTIEYRGAETEIIKKNKLNLDLISLISQVHTNTIKSRKKYSTEYSEDIEHENGYDHEMIRIKYKSNSYEQNDLYKSVNKNINEKYFAECRSGSDIIQPTCYEYFSTSGFESALITVSSIYMNQIENINETRDKFTNYAKYLLDDSKCKSGIMP